MIASVSLLLQLYYHLKDFLLLTVRVKQRRHYHRSDEMIFIGFQHHLLSINSIVAKLTEKTTIQDLP